MPSPGAASTPPCASWLACKRPSPPAPGVADEARRLGRASGAREGAAACAYGSAELQYAAPPAPAQAGEGSRPSPASAATLSSGVAGTAACAMRAPRPCAVPRKQLDICFGRRPQTSCTPAGHTRGALLQQAKRLSTHATCPAILLMHSCSRASTDAQHAMDKALMRRRCIQPQLSPCSRALGAPAGQTRPRCWTAAGRARPPGTLARSAPRAARPRPRRRPCPNPYPSAARPR